MCRPWAPLVLGHRLLCHRMQCLEQEHAQYFSSSSRFLLLPHYLRKVSLTLFFSLPPHLIFIPVFSFEIFSSEVPELEGV